MCIIFGSVGFIYARQRLSQHTDAPEEKLNTTSETITSQESEKNSSDQFISQDVASTTPDWLKEEDSSPF